MNSNLYCSYAKHEQTNQYDLAMGPFKQSLEELCCLKCGNNSDKDIAQFHLIRSHLLKLLIRKPKKGKLNKGSYGVGTSPIEVNIETAIFKQLTKHQMTTSGTCSQHPVCFFKNEEIETERISSRRKQNGPGEIKHLRESTLNRIRFSH